MIAYSNAWTPRPGKASDYINPWNTLRAGDKVVLTCRVSGREQKRRRNLANQKDFLREQLQPVGVTVDGVIEHQGSGFDPQWLKRKLLRSYGGDVTLVAISTDRFVRSLFYHTKRNNNAQARTKDLVRLAICTFDLPLVTWLHPDASTEEVQRFQAMLGQWAKGRKGGRPANKRPGYKKRRREQMLHAVLKLRDSGKSQSQIQCETGIPKPTVSRWLRLYG